MLTSTAPVLPALSDYSPPIHDTPGLPVHALCVPPVSLDLLSTSQSLCTFRVFVNAGLTLVHRGHTSPRTHCHFVM